MRVVIWAAVLLFAGYCARLACDLARSVRRPSRASAVEPESIETTPSRPDPARRTPADRDRGQVRLQGDEMVAEDPGVDPPALPLVPVPGGASDPGRSLLTAVHVAMSDAGMEMHFRKHVDMVLHRPLGWTNAEFERSLREGGSPPGLAALLLPDTEVRSRLSRQNAACVAEEPMRSVAAVCYRAGSHVEGVLGGAAGQAMLTPQQRISTLIARHGRTLPDASRAGHLRPLSDHEHGEVLRILRDGEVEEEVVRRAIWESVSAALRADAHARVDHVTACVVAAGKIHLIRSGDDPELDVLCTRHEQLLNEQRALAGEVR